MKRDFDFLNCNVSTTKINKNACNRKKNNNKTKDVHKLYSYYMLRVKLLNGKLFFALFLFDFHFMNFLLLLMLNPKVIFK